MSLLWIHPKLHLFPLYSPNQVTRVVVAIETLDVNDNPPELDGPYETAVCDTSTAGQ
ncbi:cadherin-11 isoform X1, partial [Tachysurus ichikawai]